VMAASCTASSGRAGVIGAMRKPLELSLLILVLMFLSRMISSHSWSCPFTARRQLAGLVVRRPRRSVWCERLRWRASANGLVRRLTQRHRLARRGRTNCQSQHRQCPFAKAISKKSDGA
jgi:hypothetical protein